MNNTKSYNFYDTYIEKIRASKPSLLAEIMLNVRCENKCLDCILGYLESKYKLDISISDYYTQDETRHQRMLCSIIYYQHGFITTTSKVFVNEFNCCMWVLDFILNIAKK